MENTLFANIKRLFDFELYSNVIPLASFCHTAYEHDRTILTPEQEYQLLMFEANSFFNERRFRLAESYFRQALQSKKALTRQKSFLLQTVENAYELFSDCETKYRMAVCLKEINQTRDAISVLQSIPNKSRVPKVNLLLGKLQHYEGNSNGATMAYKDVLRECPLTLEAVKSLLELNVNGIEVNTLVVNASFAPQCSDWLSNWIKAHDNMYNQKFSQAVETLKLINQTSKIRNNEYLLVLIGECLYYQGNYDAALRYLIPAHLKKPQLAEGIMALAVLYTKKNKLQELEKLTMPSLAISEYISENWFVLGQNVYVGGKYEKAAYFAQKAIYTYPRNVEAYLLKVKIFLELKKYREAMTYLRSAQTIAPYRFEIYKGLVNCYLAINRNREAQSLAAHTAKNYGQTPRSLVLLAQTFLKDTIMRNKVATFLEKALDMDEYYYPAILLMVEYYQSEGDTTGALNLLRKQVTRHPNCKLHSLMGDILMNEKDMEGALENYTIALNLDPTNMRALAGLSAMGHSTRNATKQDDSSYTQSATNEEQPVEYDHAFEMVEISPAVAGEGESESETLWSDAEVEVNHN